MRSLLLIVVTLAVTVASLIAGGLITVQFHYPPSRTADSTTEKIGTGAPHEVLREAERRRIAQEREALDALTQTNVEIALEAQRWFEKPLAYGGGGGHFAGIELAGLGYRTTGAQEYATADGVFTLTPARHSVTVTGRNIDLGLRVKTVVVGTGAENIMTTVEML